MSSDTAPDGLGLLQAFVNSVELPDGADELASPESARAWLRAHGLEAPTMAPPELRRLVEVRETLRDMLEADTGEDVGEEVVARLQKLVGRAALVAAISLGGTRLAPAQAEGVDGFVGTLSAAMVEASYKGTWTRLKVCRADTCRWAFYDRSKNGRGHWCSMQTCGTREKARTYRARKRSVQS